MPDPSLRTVSLHATLQLGFSRKRAADTCRGQSLECRQWFKQRREEADDSMTVPWSDWNGVISGRTDNVAEISLSAIKEPPGATYSGPFRGVGSDGRDYFVKSLATCPVGQEFSLVSEFVVAQVGRLIGAPVIETCLLEIPALLDGEILRPGNVLQTGIAHASVALERADEAGRPALSFRLNDDNPRRHVGIYALFDLCFGADNQWLYDLNNDRATYSHDHGLYFSGAWDSANLTAQVGVPHELADARTGLDAGELGRVVEALRALSTPALAAVLQRVPASWPVDDGLLDRIGWFLDTRAPHVADRLETSGV